MKKKHPLRRVLLAAVSTVSGVVLLLALKPTSAPATTAAGLSSASAAPKQSAAAAPARTRTVTGATVQTQYGPVQVQITVVGGRIAKVTALEYPQDTPRDQQINAFAIPQLDQEAVAAGSARIDAVSGATYTSGGYVGSLQNALDQLNGA